MMTAVHLCQSSLLPLKIIVINSGNPFGRGIAFSPYSRQHLLNVPAGKMSAFPDQPDHFVNWVLHHNYFTGLTDKALIAGSYLPRAFYGDYLEDVWREAMATKSQLVEVEVVSEYADKIEQREDGYFIFFKNSHVHCHFVVLATGNSVPAYPIPNATPIASAKYFGSPWSALSVSAEGGFKQDVLIVGNGLTMVDTVLGLMEKGFSNTIYSISPDGFSILSHRHGGQPYLKMQDDIKQLSHPYKLLEIVSLFRKHIKLVRKLGLSAEPVVDALRPFTQEIWKALSKVEKATFLSRLRHLWGVARHRLPIHVHDVIQKLRLDNKLKVYSGIIKQISKKDDLVSVTFYDKRAKTQVSISVDRVINCTGPATDIHDSDNLFLKNLWKQGLIRMDELKLGLEINTDTFRVINREGMEVKNIYALGGLVKGMFWESTAVPELRLQAKKISTDMMNQISRKSGRSAAEVSLI